MYVNNEKTQYHVAWRVITQWEDFEIVRVQQMHRYALMEYTVSVYVLTQDQTELSPVFKGSNIMNLWLFNQAKRSLEPS